MTKFNPERCKAILASISNRIPYVIAAQANGICEETFHAWIRDGFADLNNGLDTEKSRFSESVKKIEQERIKEHLDCIKEMPRNWQAQAWILERRWWKLFGAKAADIEFNDRLSALEASKKESDNATEKGK